MNIYELLRSLIQHNADMPNKDEAFALINDLEKLNTFGTSGLHQGDGKEHDCVKQTERYMDGIRLIDRCALCRKDLSIAYFEPKNAGLYSGYRRLRKQVQTRNQLTVRKGQ